MSSDAVKARQREIYSVGDYSWLSSMFMPVAERLVEAAGVRPGDRVLDVAAGDGNVATAAARRGASVVALDLTPKQIEDGRRRTEADGLDVEWREGDCEEMPFADGSFDRVLSCFGVMYAPRPEVAAAELLRVARPGGTVAVAAWPTGGFNARLLAEAMKLFPPEEQDAPDPDLWGDAEHARRYLAGAADVTYRREVLRRPIESVEAFTEEAAQNVPFMLGLRSMVTPEEFEGFMDAYRRIVGEESVREDGGLVLAVEWGLTTARRPEGGVPSAGAGADEATLAPAG